VASPYRQHDDKWLTADFWAGVAAGEFRIQRCQACGRHRFPPASFCPDCQSVEFGWEPATGRAAVWSYTVVHRAPTAELAGEVPYTLAVGELEEGPLVLARLCDVAPAEVAVGLPLTVAFHRASDGAARYHFVPRPAHD
jgi:uncharacterized OB-fold protein